MLGPAHPELEGTAKGFRSTSEAVAAAVFESLNITPNDEQTKDIIAIIEQAVVDTAVEANQRCTQTTQKHLALIMSLSAMR